MPRPDLLAAGGPGVPERPVPFLLVHILCEQCEETPPLM